VVAGLGSAPSLSRSGMAALRRGCVAAGRGLRGVGAVSSSGWGVVVGLWVGTGLGVALGWVVGPRRRLCRCFRPVAVAAARFGAAAAVVAHVAARLSPPSPPPSPSLAWGRFAVWCCSPGPGPRRPRRGGAAGARAPSRSARVAGRGGRVGGGGAPSRSPRGGWAWRYPEGRCAW